MPMIQPVTDEMQEVYDEATAYTIDIEQHDLYCADRAHIGFIISLKDAATGGSYIIPYDKLVNINDVDYTAEIDGVLLRICFLPDSGVEKTGVTVTVTDPTGLDLEVLEHYWAEVPEEEFEIDESDCDMS